MEIRICKKKKILTKSFGQNIRNDNRLFFSDGSHMFYGTIRFELKWMATKKKKVKSEKLTSSRRRFSTWYFWWFSCAASWLASRSSFMDRIFFFNTSNNEPWLAIFFCFLLNWNWKYEKMQNLFVDTILFNKELQIENDVSRWKTKTKQIYKSIWSQIVIWWWQY